MSFVSKRALALVVPVAGALVGTAAAPAHAAGDLYGAIAVAWGTSAGLAVDYPSQAAADKAAVEACGTNRCLVMARARNECASVAEYDHWTVWKNSVEPVYGTGLGPTRAAAEQAAMDSGHYNLSFPTTATASALGLIRIVKPLFILDTICTSNAD
ncbi:DUF4189 domain-containing protein [Nocardia sp. NPDC051832]|uniref:DUF4189 domain-containing protein n=1 Tax=Nocardia sp. NPDC051832 TaxID=3155673 RepID=UPI00343643EF